MNIKNLFAIVAVALLLAACSKPKSSLAGETMYLTSATLQNSRYLQMSLNFKGMQQVEIFAITSFHPMYGDVTAGKYSFTGDELYLPKLGAFAVKQKGKEFYLYQRGKLAFKLSKSMQPFIRSGANEPQRQYQFASITTTH